jgi:shikimate kinase
VNPDIFYQDRICARCGHHLPLDQSEEGLGGTVHDDIRICEELEERSGNKNPRAVIIASSGTGKTALQKRLTAAGYDALDVDDTFEIATDDELAKLKQYRQEADWEKHNALFYPIVVRLFRERDPDIFLTHGLNFIEILGKAREHLIHLKTTPGVSIRRALERQSRKGDTEQELALSARLAATNYETNLIDISKYDGEISEVDADVSPDAVATQVIDLLGELS